ncbi:MAG: PKD domain-containing protein [Candidatus Paceibacterota bacterium]
MFKSKLSVILFPIILCGFLFGIVYSISADCPACPAFNNCAGDLELLTLKNRTQNTPSWQSSISANAGDTVAFNVYYHNCVSGTTANSTKIRLDFTNIESSPILTTAYLWADNASYVTDSGTITVSTPQKLNFASTAKWYPDQTSSNPTIVPVTINITSVQVNIGNIEGNWTHQGYVVFEATLSGSGSTNHAPTANAGPDKDIQEGETTTLNGSGSDPDGDPLTYSWSCTGGSLSSYSTAQPTYTAPSVSSNTYYNCTLTVRDDEGLTGTDSMVVYVRNQDSGDLFVSLSPNPSSGNAPLNNVSLTADLSGTASGDATFKYDCTNDGSWERITSANSNSNTAYSLCNYYSSGNYTAKVEVTRGGVTNYATAVVYVYDNNQTNHAPTANAGPDKDVYENQSTTLEGSGYDQDGDPLYYSWSCTGGSLSSYSIARPTYTAPSVSYNNYYNCVLTVRDDEGLSASDNMVVYVREQSSGNFSVSLTPNPSSGNAPLNNVSLTAYLSGDASGDATYKYDCTNDGSWERITSANANSNTAYSLCNYYTNGNYTAKVEVTRGGMTNYATAVVYVGGSSQTGTFVVTKLVKNLSDGTGWQTSVSADPGEVLYFSIQVTALNNTQDVIIKDILPSKLIYGGDLRLDNVPTAGDIINGFNIGYLSANQTRTITFKATVANADQFVYGTTELTNTAQINNSSYTGGAAKINVTRSAVAGAITTVVTGINPLFISLMIAFLLALAFYFFWTNLEKSQNPSARRFLSWYYRMRSLIFK